jgi:transposase
LKAFYSDIGRPSIDLELMIRMLLVGYCYGIRHERRLCQEVALHSASPISTIGFRTIRRSR